MLQSLFLNIEVSICSCYGDPHCSTFDDLQFDYQGTCKYLFAGVIAGRGTLPGFQVFTRNDHFFSTTNTAVAYVAYVEVVFDSGDIVRLTRDNSNGKIPVMMLVSNKISMKLKSTKPQLLLPLHPGSFVVWTLAIV